ncbi:MAG: hypothetical protein ACE5ID_03540, partial [Acidobacteriota bacterium]
MKVEKRHGGINALSIFETAVASLRDAFLEVFDENRLLRSHSSEADTLERRESRCGRGGDSPAEEGRAFETQSGRTGNGAVVGSGDDLLTSLYVASFSLHRTRDFELVMSSIKEILINLIGAERFQIFLGDRTQQCLVLVDDETNEGPSPRKIALTEGIVGVVAKTGIAYFETERRTGDFYDPLA